MAHQALQHLQRNACIEHVHCVGVAEGMRRHRNGERHPVGSRGLHSFTEPCTDGTVGDFPDARLSVLPVRLLRRSCGIFSVATIISSWLA